MWRPGPACLMLGLALGLTAPAQLSAQSSGITLPGASGQTCVQVNVPGQKPSPYNCLNQQLQQDVQGQSQAQPSLPLAASSPSNRVGTFNEQSVAEQYGENFGVSATPYRPPPPVYGNALGPAR